MRNGTIIAGLLIVWSAANGAAFAQSKSACANPNALGLARTVEIDTTDAPGFGFEHYKAYDFLRLKEVVLTFDDGPQVGYTHKVLEALAAHCTKATFFSIGKMAAGLPEIIRDVAKAGHTIGTHTWSHADISKLKNEADWKAEIEKGVSAVRRAVGGPIAPFFRYPVLKDTKESLAHLASRNIAPPISTASTSSSATPRGSRSRSWRGWRRWVRASCCSTTSSPSRRKRSPRCSPSSRPGDTRSCT